MARCRIDDVSVLAMVETCTKEQFWFETFDDILTTITKRLPREVGSIQLTDWNLLAKELPLPAYLPMSRSSSTQTP
jgi:hypothetical protein